MPRSAVTPALCQGSAIGRPTELDLGLPSGELPAGWALLASWVARDLGAVSRKVFGQKNWLWVRPKEAGRL